MLSKTSPRRPFCKLHIGSVLCLIAAMACSSLAQAPPARNAGGPGRGRFQPNVVLAERLLPLADRNEDGSLSKSELMALASVWFGKIDEAGTGKLTQEPFANGFTAALSSEQDSQPAGGRGPGRLWGFMAGGIFAAADANEDRSLTKDELSGVLGKWFDDWDADGSAAVDATELAAGLQAVLPVRRATGGPGRGPTPDDAGGFQSIFDGRSLAEWDGEPGFWSVHDGAIVGESTAEKPLSANTFLIWQGQVADFELKLEYKMGPVGNSGIQYRSSAVPDVSRWALKGYQADMDADNRFTGMIYEERGRGFLAPRGQFSRIAADGTTKLVGTVGENSALGEFVKANDWNQVHIIAKGNVLMQLVNGHVMSVVVDEHEEGRAAKGLLGFQLHVGPPMRILFRNVLLKPLATGPAAEEQVISARQGNENTAKRVLETAIERLTQRSGYRWTTTENSGRSPFGGGPNVTRGETKRDGFTQVRSNQLNFVRKAGQVAVELQENWMSLEQALQRTGGGGRPGRGAPNLNAVNDFSLPLDTARDFLARASGWTQTGDAIQGTLAGDEVANLLAPPRFGRRGPGGGGPRVQNPQGTVTFQITDGQLAKLTVALQGTMNFRGEDRLLERTTTIAIESLTADAIQVPADAQEIVEALIAGRTPQVFVPEPGFEKLFNGRDLSGWAGRAEHWSVEDGAIVGRTTKESPARGNNFLIAQDGDKNLIVDDFELRFSYRVTPNNDQGFANSGMQYRSQAMDHFVVRGYQADFEAGDTYSGILYDEGGGAGGRGIMAERGQAVVWNAKGEKEVVGQLESSEAIQAAIRKDGWNEYTIIARGNHLQHFINGKQTIDVIDDTVEKRLKAGVLALQVHAGEPMTVVLKDIRIKSLSAAENVAAGNISVAEDFKLDLLYSVPKESEGSWVASCLDDQGRMIVSDQNGKLYRFALPEPGRTGPLQPEPIDLQIGGAHGLLYAFDSLYVMVNEGNELTHGLYRVFDTDGDDQFDEVKLLRAIEGGGEHGLHAVVPSPDGQSLYIVCGNQTNFFTTEQSRVPRHWGEDELLPRLETGFMAGVLAPGGVIAKTDPEGKQWELIANGFRNEFDIAFNREGELFTFDADMEWDIGDPWYRPTRVNHVISGAEFGWRSGAGKWPDYFLDSFGAVVNIGPGSPTGVTFGYGARFPAKYQDALFIADWSFGKLYAVHLEPQGASYVGHPEEFVTGQPFPITDVLVNPQDGAMYVTVGGRQTQSALYRITYVGNASTEPGQGRGGFQEQRTLRRRLESYHGRRDEEAVDAAWPHLGSPDRATRFAARIALEWQDPSQWQARALEESDPRTAIAALAALARASGRDERHRSADASAPDRDLQARMLAALDRIHWESLSQDDQVDLLRAFTLVFTRLGAPEESVRQDLIDKFDPLYPAASRPLNRMLAHLLVYLESPQAASKTMALMRSAPTQEEQIDYALVLRQLKTGWTMELREEYFRWFSETAVNYRGGNTFASSLRTMKEQAVANLSDDERDALRPILEATTEPKSPQELLDAREHVKDWTLDELVPLVEDGMKQARDFERGRQLYAAVACASCHRLNQDGGLAGPDLSGVAGRFGVRDLLESVVDPSKVISDQYAAINIITKDGRVITGRIGNLSGDSVSVVENMLNPGNMTGVSRRDIEAMEPSAVSVMPAGLLNTLTADEIQDLMAYLLSGGVSQHALYQQASDN